MRFTRILIANRGEIACRIIRTARLMGYDTVAVYSEADHDAPHVRLADAAVPIGPAPAVLSYLNVDALLKAAHASGADAIHPGYGFLSENASFAQAVVDAGLVFIGPPASAITVMGDKARAKACMQDAGVPCVPGYMGADQSDASMLHHAKALGFPVLVKAVAGGGGRGMRLVRNEDDLFEALASARREALSAFGDAHLMLERLINHGRHIEVQIFGDAHGQVIHLGERDCTSQRRRQKVIEEAPSPVVNAELREALGRDAIIAAQAVGYFGAGTVEFIVDEQMQHFFLEMNTRLQVEHPVTEMVTGLDLVEWQLRVAAGEPLPLTQKDVRLRGHAIEVRLYAEDPVQGFAPQTGKVLWWQPDDARMPGLRIDDGIAPGQHIGPHYDPMLAKLIAHGKDRADAIRRLRAALRRAPLLGVGTNAAFLSDLLDHSDFRAARMTTTRLDEWQEQQHPIMQAVPPLPQVWALAAAVLGSGVLSIGETAAMRSNSVTQFTMTLQCEDLRRTFELNILAGGAVHVGLPEYPEGLVFDNIQRDQARLRFRSEGVDRQGFAVLHQSHLHIALQGRSWIFSEPVTWNKSGNAQDAGRVTARVAGKVTQVKVQEGDRVNADQPMVCIEAMKMEMWMGAPTNAQIQAVHVKEGEQVEAGTLLVELRPAETSSSTTQEP